MKVLVTELADWRAFAKRYPGIGATSLATACDRIESLQRELADVRAAAKRVVDRHDNRTLIAIDGALSLVEDPGIRAVGAPGSVTRRAWDLGKELESLRRYKGWSER